MSTRRITDISKDLPVLNRWVQDKDAFEDRLKEKEQKYDKGIERLGKGVDKDGNLLLKNTAQVVGTTSSPTTTSSTAAVLAEMTQSVVTKGNPVLLSFYGTFSESGGSADAVLGLQFFRDGASVGREIQNTLQVGTGEKPVSFIIVDTVAPAGARTYDVRWRRVSGTGTIRTLTTLRSMQLVELG